MCLAAIDSRQDEAAYSIFVHCIAVDVDSVHLRNAARSVYAVALEPRLCCHSEYSNLYNRFFILYNISFPLKAVLFVVSFC